MFGEGKPLPHHKRHTRTQCRAAWLAARRRATRRVDLWGIWYRELADEDDRRHRIARETSQRRTCSCYICSRGRRYRGITMQERRMALAAAAELADVRGEGVWPPGHVYEEEGPDREDWEGHPSFVGRKRAA